jgi:CubicO group peptidase (beta-lactamase class C family)
MNMNLGALTTRQLLTHHSGLANSDDTAPGAGGVPRAYTSVTPDIGHCLSRPAKPGAPFAYNNCDYIVLGEMLRYAAEAPPGKLPPPITWPKGMAMAQPGEKGVPGFVGGKPEPAFELGAWGAAGGLIGTAKAVFDFDRALMTDAVMAQGGRDELWKPEGKGSYQALGQWVFPGQLKGCAAPKRIVQRDGEIYGVQARNFILPDDDLVVIVFTNRSSDDFAIGEVWQGKGFAYDLLSAAACP